MEHYNIIIGGGISGLYLANKINDKQTLLLRKK